MPRSWLPLLLPLVVSPTALADTPVDAPPDDDTGGAVFRAVHAQGPSLRACAEEALRGRERLEGMVHIVWTLRNERPRRVRVEANTTGSDVLGACVARAVRRWTFEGAEDGEAFSKYLFDEGR